MKSLLVFGVALFLLGLLNGLLVPYFTNPRMGLAAHLAGVQNALVLMAFGLMWKYVRLSALMLRICAFLSVYSMTAIWISLVFAAMWGTSAATPIAGAGYVGSETQELVVNLFLYSGSLAIIVATCQVLIGLCRNIEFDT